MILRYYELNFFNSFFYIIIKLGVEILFNIMDIMNIIRYYECLPTGGKSILDLVLEIFYTCSNSDRWSGTASSTTQPINYPPFV